MKKVLLLAALMLFTLTSAIKAQTAPKDYFAGKWELVVEETPNGDMPMKIELIRTDGKLSGEMVGPDGAKTKFDSIEELAEKETVVLYFNISGFDVSVDIIKKTDNEVTGSAMGMFNVKGKRVK